MWQHLNWGSDFATHTKHFRKLLLFTEKVFSGSTDVKVKEFWEVLVRSANALCGRLKFRFKTKRFTGNPEMMGFAKRWHLYRHFIVCFEMYAPFQNVSEDYLVHWVGDERYWPSSTENCSLIESESELNLQISLVSVDSARLRIRKFAFNVSFTRLNLPFDLAGLQGTSQKERSPRLPVKIRISRTKRTET